ncbi:ABC transporter ATP-binding protein [Amphritea balenae]|uniref:ATP-binding cassette domain-containing protein n=1 Tax=Amphritea balenae TaxID=452629 RepID=A0A3P1SWR1_9GAMM|nr:ATP-binding cassette domain-containing protein [Amphritea balenae]RRD01564.1 ATP-binding cassette domain-containing protein [Amphritea balenae]GGK55864.1 histidine ABC transporter ATP-binding protein [Amphritea balenae]
MSTKSISEAALYAEDLHKSFGGIEVLKGVSLTAQKHDVISIIGSSGSGKSTFLRCMNLLEFPDAGKIRVHGEKLDLSQNSRGGRSKHVQQQIERIRSCLGMVFQSFNLWSHMSVLENVMLGPCSVLKRNRDEVEVQARALLDRVGMLEKCHMYPDNLSGGQKQRVAIARALAMDPDVMLFDEPTSALDPELVNEVLLVIRELAEEGRTMIMVTHEMRFARDVSSQVVYLHQGRIEEQGSPEQLFNNPRSEHLQRFLSSQY